jgi:predicted nucleic acid-binding protein
VICCDTSFLFSLYGADTHTRKALGRLAGSRSKSIILSPFNEYEFTQAVSFSVWRGLRTAGQADRITAAFEADIGSGNLVLVQVNMATVLIEARRLSATYTRQRGHRAFDILHVASAVHLAATEFFTFDQDQRMLATAAGLQAGP